MTSRKSAWRQLTEFKGRLFSALRTLRHFHSLLTRLEALERRLEVSQERQDALKSHLELGREEFWSFQHYRQTKDYRRAYNDANPLVTVCVATYNRAELLTERCIPSILNQTYKNIELIVVGDHCTDDTSERIKRIKDPRLMFVNLPEPGAYPQERRRRWMVGGTTPENHALTLARGLFITHLDDDDEYIPERIERLLNHAREQEADLVISPFFVQNKYGEWVARGGEKFSDGNVTTSSIFYHHWFKRITCNIDAHLLDEPGDWGRFRKFKYLGAKVALYSDPLLLHYPEQSNAGLSCNSTHGENNRPPTEPDPNLTMVQT